MIPGSGISPGEEKGTLLQYSGLENPMDCTAHGVAKSRTRQQLSLHFQCRGVGLIPGQGDKIPHASGPKNQNRKQKKYCNKFNKDFKNGPHKRKKKLKKRASPKILVSELYNIAWFLRNTDFHGNQYDLMGLYRDKHLSISFLGGGFLHKWYIYFKILVFSY